MRAWAARLRRIALRKGDPVVGRRAACERGHELLSPHEIQGEMRRGRDCDRVGAAGRRGLFAEQMKARDRAALMTAGASERVETTQERRRRGDGGAARERDLGEVAGREELAEGSIGAAREPTRADRDRLLREHVVWQEQGAAVSRSRFSGRTSHSSNAARRFGSACNMATSGEFSSGAAKREPPSDSWNTRIRYSACPPRSGRIVDGQRTRCRLTSSERNARSRSDASGPSLSVSRAASAAPLSAGSSHRLAAAAQSASRTQAVNAIVAGSREAMLVPLAVVSYGEPVQEAHLTARTIRGEGPSFEAIAHAHELEPRILRSQPVCVERRCAFAIPTPLFGSSCFVRRDLARAARPRCRSACRMKARRCRSRASRRASCRDRDRCSPARAARRRR